MPSSVSAGDRPSGPRASTRASTWSCTPATRTMKNSSRLVTKIARNLSRSISGSDSSSASWSTRSLKSSQDSSRLANSRIRAGRAPRRSAVGGVRRRVGRGRRCRSCHPLVRPRRSRPARSGAAARPARPWRSPARPPLRIRACAPGEVVEGQRERRVVADQQHVARARRSARARRTARRESAGSTVGVDARAARTRAGRSAARGASGWSGTRRGATPRRASARPAASAWWIPRSVSGRSSSGIPSTASACRSNQSTP